MRFMREKSTREAALRRIDVAFQRGAGAEGDDGHAMRAGDVARRAHLLGVLHPDHGIGRLVGDPGDGVGVLAADCLAGLQPVAEALAQDADGGGHVAARDCPCDAVAGMAILPTLECSVPLAAEAAFAGCYEPPGTLPSLRGNNVHMLV